MVVGVIIGGAMTNKVVEKHAKLIGYSDEGPTIIKPQYMELFEKFLTTQTAKEIKLLFKDTYSKMIQILFISVLLNRTSRPFRSGKTYEPSLFSVECLRDLGKYFTSAFKQEFKRRRIDVFDFADNYVYVHPKSKSKLLNALVFPRVVMIQHLKSADMDRVINSLRGYMYKDFPREFAVPGFNIALDALHNSPIYHWHFYGHFSGFKVFMRRVRKDTLCMRIEFDLPFILPLGKFSELSMVSLLKKTISSFDFGV